MPRNPKMYKLKCKNCSKEFEDDRPRKFCSSDCYLAYRKKRAVTDRIEQLRAMQEIFNEAKD
jgi:rRNA maturation endonuclease Nob1